MWASQSGAIGEPLCDDGVHGCNCRVCVCGRLQVASRAIRSWWQFATAISARSRRAASFRSERISPPTSQLRPVVMPGKMVSRTGIAVQWRWQQGNSPTVVPWARGAPEGQFPCAPRPPKGARELCPELGRRKPLLNGLSKPNFSCRARRSDHACSAGKSGVFRATQQHASWRVRVVLLMNRPGANMRQRSSIRFCKSLTHWASSRPISAAPARRTTGLIPASSWPSYRSAMTA